MLGYRLANTSLRLSTSVAFFFATVIAVLALSAFGGGNPVSVTVNPATSTLDASDSLSLTATVNFDVNAAGVTWTVTGGGTLSNKTKTTVTYTAPAAGSTALTVTVTATSVANTNATATATITVPAKLHFTTTSLPSANVGSPYSATLVAAGGIPPYKFVQRSGSLSACLTLSSAGVISGTPLAACVSNQNPTFTVTDSGKATALTANSTNLNLKILAAPAIVFPASVPPATYNKPYSASVVATGGVGKLTYSLRSGALPTGLSLGADALITGTPTVVSNFQFDIKAVDAFGDSFIKVYSIKVSYSAVVVAVKSLPVGYVGSAYPSTTLTASGGSGTGYKWLLDNSTVLPAGLSLSSGGVITGTPTGPTGTTDFTVKATDSAANTGTGNFSILVDPSLGTKVSGQINNLNNWCGNGTVPGYPPIKVSINTNPVKTTTADSNGFFSFSNVPAGSYTITPSLVALSGATAVFYPASESVTASGSSVIAKNFTFSLGMTVSGAVSYAGTQTGQTYISLSSNNCGGGGQPGTSIPQAKLTSGGEFTIRGVPPGNYTMLAVMDTTGQSQGVLSDPTGTATLVVPTNESVTGADITMTDPTVSTPKTGPQIAAISPTNLGVVISFNEIQNSNGEEAVSGYTVEWSTSSSFTSPATHAEKAVGHDAPFWILNTGITGLSGTFVNGTGYYFRARGELANRTIHTPWTVYGGSTPVKVTVGAPSTTGTFAVTGEVTIPAAITPTGPLYVLLFNPQTDEGYATYIAAPTNSSPNDFTLHVPDAAAEYYFVGILDQNNDGQIDVGDITNIRDQGHNSNTPSLTVTGNTSGHDLTLPSAAGSSYAGVQFFDVTATGGTNYYNLNFGVRQLNKMPVTVTLASASNPNVVIPTDIALCSTNCGNPQWDFNPTIGSDTPKVGDTYTFDVTFSDGTSGTLVATVVGWNGTSTLVGLSDAPTKLEPSGSSSTSTKPIFTWTDPSTSTSLAYAFYLYQAQGPTIWQVPSNNSNTNGFPGSIDSLKLGTDPTCSPSATCNPPSVTALTSGTEYTWVLQVLDTLGNQAQTQANYTP